MTDYADRYRRLSDELTRRVEAVSDDRWDDPSPCAGWSARDVLRHVIESSRDMPKSVGETVTLQRSVDDDPVGAWLELRDAIRELMDDPARAGKEYDGYFGRTSLEKTIDGFLSFDLLVHGWDIARAIGQDETLPADEVTRVLADAHDLGDTLQTSGVCGPPVDVPADASEQDRLLAVLGRTP